MASRPHVIVGPSRRKSFPAKNGNGNSDLASLRKFAIISSAVVICIFIYYWPALFPPPPATFVLAHHPAFSEGRIAKLHSMLTNMMIGNRTSRSLNKLTTHLQQFEEAKKNSSQWKLTDCFLESGKLERQVKKTGDIERSIISIRGEMDDNNKQLTLIRASEEKCQDDYNKNNLKIIVLQSDLTDAAAMEKKLQAQLSEVENRTRQRNLVLIQTKDRLRFYSDFAATNSDHDHPHHSTGKSDLEKLRAQLKVLEDEDGGSTGKVSMFSLNAPDASYMLSREEQQFFQQMDQKKPTIGAITNF